MTALMRAAQSGDVEMAKLLVSFGAEIDTRNQDGLTAVDIATLFGNGEVLNTLADCKKYQKSVIG